MSSLRVTLPTSLDLYIKGRTEQYLLGVPGLTSVSKRTIHAVVTSQIVEDQRSSIYRATIPTHGNVVLKFHLEEYRSMDDLREEASLYTGQLKDLQGTVIPRYHGLYVGGDESQEQFVCIVLEDCGDPPRDVFHRHYSQDERIEILKQLFELHKKGYIPKTFEEENVVGEPGAYRLVGLRVPFKTDHKCEFDGQWYADERIPVDKFSCNWLFQDGLTMRVWAQWGRPFVKIFGRPYYNIEDYPCQPEIDELSKFVPKSFDEDCDRPILSGWFKDVKKMMDVVEKAGEKPLTAQMVMEHVKMPKFS
ncbi:hypothetical protein DFH11DRAFT_1550722 [Phellopilus nigrolimitatus]|nr:hypothetical protein DFH11DRAFT_1550722 [Phellopilus nigrolimitatus]